MYTYHFCPVCGNNLQERPHDSNHRNYCPQCGFVHYINPLPAVVAVVEKEGHFLLVQRGKSPAQGEWTFPSGFMEAGETPEAACLRELKEETGVEGTILSLIGVYYELSEMYGDVLNIAYQVQLAGEALPHAGDDAAAVDYVPIADTENIAFTSFRQARKDYLEKTQNQKEDES